MVKRCGFVLPTGGQCPVEVHDSYRLCMAHRLCQGVDAIGSSRRPCLAALGRGARTGYCRKHTRKVAGQRIGVSR